MYTNSINGINEYLESKIHRISSLMNVSSNIELECESSIWKSIVNAKMSHDMIAIKYAIFNYIS